MTCHACAKEVREGKAAADQCFNTRAEAVEEGKESKSETCGCGHAPRVNDSTTVPIVIATAFTAAPAPTPAARRLRLFEEEDLSDTASRGSTHNVSINYIW